MELYELKEEQEKVILVGVHFVYHKSKFLTKSMKCFQEFVLENR